MSCRNCRSQVLDTWLYCPQCGTPTPLGTRLAPCDSSLTLPGTSQVSPVRILDRLGAGVLLVTPRGRIGHINSAARALFKISANQNILGKPCAEFIQHEECMAIIKRQLARGIPSASHAEDEDAKKPDEIALKDDQDQDLFYQVHITHIQDDSSVPAGIIYLFHDITDLRNIARMKTEFVSIVAHELRTPLTPLKGFVSTLLDDEKEEWYDRETRREFYTIIDENVDRLSRLVNDLLGVSRIERLGVGGIEMNWEPNVGIRKVAEEVLRTQRGRTDKHTFVLDFEPEDIEIEADREKFQNILQNFVSNAIKYSPKGGEIRIIARLKPADADFPYSSVWIGIKDPGMGIDLNRLKRMGKAFCDVRSSGRPKASDTGIGLYLVKALIAAHHGVMTVDSELGKGSTFGIRLPLCRLTPEESAQEEKHERPTLFGIAYQ